MSTNTDEQIAVLHVDDDPSFADLTATVLDGEEHISVQTATGPEEGLQAVAETGVDCVVSDYQMPGTDGIEFLEAVREDHPDLPFILFTGKGSEELASEAISAGVTDYLQKGSGTEQYTILANRIENAVAQYRAEREVEHTREYFTEMLAHASDFVMITDRDVQVEYVSPAVERVLGYTPAELEGTNAFELIHPDDRSVAGDARDALLEGDAEEKTVKFRASHADGSWRWLEVRGQNRLADPVIEGLIVSASDVTERSERRREFRRLKRAMDAAPIGITLSNPSEEDNPLVYANDHFEEITGYTAEATLGRNCRFLQGEETDPEPVARIREAIDEERPVTAELRNYRADGTAFWNRVSIAPVFDDGEVVNYVGFQQDVTDRKRRKRRLSETTSRLDVLFEQSPDMINVHDAEGNIIDPNPRLCDATGYDEAELTEMKIWDLDQTSDPERALAFWEEMEPGDSECFEAVFQRRDGSTFPVEVHVRQLERDGEQRFVATSRDITERTEAEQRLQAYVDSASDVLGIVSEAGVFEDLSPSATRVLGYDPAELEGEFVFEYVHPEDRDRVMEEFWELVDADTSETKRVEYRFRQPDGSWKWLESVGSDRSASTIDGYVITTRDISARKAREQELMAERDRLDEFVSVVSHDLRNPLNVATTRMELAQRDYDSEHLDQVEQAHERMEALIDDLLQLARTDEHTSERGTLDLAEVVDGCWETVETGTTTLEVDVDCEVVADESQLKQVLENLVRNAIEHGGETVTVGGLPDGFYVADDGPGIPPEDREEIFEAGYSTQEDGTGFGLRIVREIVTAHGWEIAVTDSEEGGARFEITGAECPS